MAAPSKYIRKASFWEKKKFRCVFSGWAGCRFFCQSLDKKTTGYYDVAARKWEKLPGKYNAEIDTAMEIGAKRRPVDLVNLPLGRMSVR